MNLSETDTLVFFDNDENASAKKIYIKMMIIKLVVIVI